MSYFRCLCGDRIDLTPHPNKHEFHLFSASLLESVLGEIALELGRGLSARDFENRLYAIVFRGKGAPYLVNECPQCGRLYVFDRSIEDEMPILRYVQDESGKPHRLLNAPSSQEP